MAMQMRIPPRDSLLHEPPMANHDRFPSQCVRSKGGQEERGFRHVIHERLRNELTQLPRIRSVRDDKKFAMVKSIWADGISGTRQWHRERSFAHLMLFHLVVPRSVPIVRTCRVLLQNRTCERPPACPAAQISLDDSDF